MQRKATLLNWLDVWARVLLVGTIAWLLNLAALPHALERFLQDYTRAVRSGQPGAAAASLEGAAAYLPWRKDLIVAAARYRLQAGDMAPAIALLEEADQQDLFSGSDWLALGDAYRASGKLEQAEGAWQKALAMGGPELAIYDRLHQMYRDQANYPAALEALRSTLLLRPDEPQRAYQVGLYLAALQPAAALVYFEQSAAAEGSQAEAARELLRVIRTALLSDEPAYVYLQSGRRLAEMGEWSLAGEAFRQSVQARPDYAEAWAFLGEARQQVGGDRAQALSELHQAYRLNPESAAVNSLFALYWQRLGQVEKMVTYLSAAAAAEPQNPVWQAELGRALALDGDLEAARQCYEQAVQLAPQEAQYWRLLGEFSLNYQVDLAGLGLPAMRRALALAPQEAASLDLIGATYITLENDPLAERFLIQAQQADPGYAATYLHLGVLNLYRGQMDAAQRLLRKAEQLAGPGSEVSAQAWRLLAYYFK